MRCPESKTIAVQYVGPSLTSSLTGKKASVDHCHKTGKIRALLCHDCNTMIGLGCESIRIFGQAIRYLKMHQ